MTQDQTENRREVGSRKSSFAKKMAKRLAGLNVSPNQISTLSMVFAAVALTCFWYARVDSWLLVGAVLGIQGRLLCNLFDGMLAIEYHKKSKVGELYNEVPDRISDALIILGAGLFASENRYAMDLAWGAVFLSTMTAYVRVFGAALVKKHYFIGPMAKQHRMALLSAASLVNLFIMNAVYASLILLVAGCVITILRRLLFIARDLKAETR